MRAPSRSESRSTPSLPFILLLVFLAVLWVGGGASRADALGQVVVRSVAWLLLVLIILFGERPAPGRERPVLLLLLAALLLALLQLAPLPPGLWQALPGRSILKEAVAMNGQAQPWRPWSIAPSATVNAASSLIIPLTTFVLITGLKPSERAWLPALILGLIVAAALVGLAQFSGATLNNPLINQPAGDVSGNFANRNHFALFLVLGCLLTPVWAVEARSKTGWRAPVALGLIPFFILLILASGSRAGLVLGVIGLTVGLVLTRRGLKRELSRYPRWTGPATIAGIVGMVVIFVALSVAADRAVSINRVFTVDPGQDMRGRGLPVVLAMVRTYFPVGSGLGGFDSIFRMHEPFGLLKPTYFNHAHDDLLEVVLDAGLPGLWMLLAALLWWGWASTRVWSPAAGARHTAPKLGSAVLLLIILASAFDYPARTPMMMAVMVVAGIWLSSGGAERRGSALPKESQHL